MSSPLAAPVTGQARLSRMFSATPQEAVEVEPDWPFDVDAVRLQPSPPRILFALLSFLSSQCFLSERRKSGWVGRYAPLQLASVNSLV